MASSVIDGSDSLSAATAPLTFHDFLERMKQPAAADLVRSIKSFIVSFGNGSSDPDVDSEKVQAFFRATEVSFTTGPVWAGASPEELESAGEGLEKYLMTKLYPKAFAPTEEEVERDKKLSAKLSALAEFVDPEHLDIPAHFRNEGAWLLAQKELQKIGSFKAPRDKLVCVLNCCRLINNILLNASITSSPSSNSSSPPGADDFLPLLIYIVIKAKPPQLHCNLLYIQRYRHSERLVSEAAYFFTNLVSAAAFVESCTAEHFSMPPSEFDNKLQQALNLGAQLPLSGPDQLAGAEKGTKGSFAGKGGGEEEEGGVGKVGKGAGQAREEGLGREEGGVKERRVTVRDMQRGVAAEVLRIDASGDLGKEYRFLYASEGDLRVGDVAELLAEYKSLALKYSTLCRAIHGLKFTPPADQRVMSSALIPKSVKHEQESVRGEGEERLVGGEDSGKIEVGNAAVKDSGGGGYADGVESTGVRKASEVVPPEAKVEGSEEVGSSGGLFEGMSLSEEGGDEKEESNTDAAVGRGKESSVVDQKPVIPRDVEVVERLNSQEL